MNFRLIGSRWINLEAVAVGTPRQDGGGTLELLAASEKGALAPIHLDAEEWNQFIEYINPSKIPLPRL